MNLDSALFSPEARKEAYLRYAAINILFLFPSSPSPSAVGPSDNPGVGAVGTRPCFATFASTRFASSDSLDTVEAVCARSLSVVYEYCARWSPAFSRFEFRVEFDRLRLRLRVQSSFYAAWLLHFHLIFVLKCSTVTRSEVNGSGRTCRIASTTHRLANFGLLGRVLFSLENLFC